MEEGNRAAELAGMVPVGHPEWVAERFRLASGTGGWCEKNGRNATYTKSKTLPNQTTAWFLDHPIGLALHSRSFDKLSGEVEADTRAQESQEAVLDVAL